MNKRTKLGAVVAAGLLTFAVAGTAFAASLLSGQVGAAVSSFDVGTASDCAAQFPDLAAGQVGLYFVQSPTNANSGDLSGTTSAGAFGPTGQHSSPGKTLTWAITITGDGSTTVDSATSTASGGTIKVSHVCFGSGGGGGGGGGNEETTPPATDIAPATGTSGPSDGSWLLVVGLGVLLASLVVLTPARAKSRR